MGVSEDKLRQFIKWRDAHGPDVDEAVMKATGTDNGSRLDGTKATLI